MVHDWGGLIGLRWACDHPGAVRALVISSSGFFPDGKWHGMAKALRTEGTGEELIANMTEEGWAHVLRQTSPNIDDAAVGEYWKAFSDEDRRRGAPRAVPLGGLREAAPLRGRPGPAGRADAGAVGGGRPFAPVAGARRLQAEIPGSELVVIPGTGHFVVEDDPGRYGAELGRFLRGVPSA